MKNILSNIKERVLYLSENVEVTKQEFFRKIGITYGNFTGKKKERPLNSDAIENILLIYPETNPEWLLTGKGEMLKDEKAEKQEKQKNLIPLYDDVATIGGTSSVVELSGNSKPTEYIDAGDWFTNVTAAIRHYGDSMVEYPNGCILALRAINDINSIVWGRTYVIETNEIRVTKRMQTCPEDDNYIMAYSTNNETYVDGRLVHEPFRIKKEDIRRIFMVLGRVVKEYSSDPVFTM
ncbi:S24 family peptidase [Ornithobacterium rhinotracheale]